MPLYNYVTGRQHVNLLPIFLNNNKETIFLSFTYKNNLLSVKKFESKNLKKNSNSRS